MTKLKKLFTLAILFLATATMFVGCSIFELDVARMRNTVVAEVGDSISLNKGEVIDGFNSFGYQYMSEDYGSLSYEEAIDQTIEILLDRKIILQLAKEDGIVATDADKNQARAAAYDAIDEALVTLESEVRVDLDKEIVITEDYKGEAAATYTEYQPEYNMVGLESKKVEYEEQAPEIVPAVWNQSISDPEVSKEALTRLVNNLKKSEEGLNHEDNSDLAVINRQIDKIYVQELENLIIEKYQQAYTDSARSMEQEFEDIYTYSNYLTQSQKEQWATGVQTVSTFTSSITSSLDGIYYIPDNLTFTDENGNTQDLIFFNVSHLLISFDEQTLAEISKIESDYDSGKIGIEEEYLEQAKQDAINAVVANVEVTARDADGYVIEGSEKTLAQIQAEVQAAMIGKTNEQKAEIFRNYIYMYNTDPGMENAEYEYVIPNDASKSAMVETFTDKSIELFSSENGEDGYILADEFVVSEHGAHLIFYSRPVSSGAYAGNVYTGYLQSLFAVDSTNGATLSAKLDTVMLTSYGSKSYYDLFREKVVQNKYSSFELIELNSYKANNQTKHYTDKIDELKNN